MTIQVRVKLEGSGADLLVADHMDAKPVTVLTGGHGIRITTNKVTISMSKWDFARIIEAVSLGDRQTFNPMNQADPFGILDRPDASST